MLNTNLNAYLRLVLLAVIFTLSTVWLYLLVRYGPWTDTATNSVQFATNLSQLQQLSETLSKYRQTHSYYVFTLFCSAYLFKQTFGIPGSVLMNLLAGALYNVWFGFVLSCLLTAIGATFCYSLSKFCGKYFVAKYFPQRIETLQKKVEENRSQLIFTLLFLRLFPMSPNWFINIASPIIGVPIHLFFVSVLIGLMPYNFICVQTGSLLSQLKSLDDILSASNIIKLVAIAFVALLPAIIIRHKKAKNQQNTQ